MVTQVINICMFAMAIFVTIFTLIIKVKNLRMFAVITFFTIVTLVTQVTSEPFAVITFFQWLFGATILPEFMWFLW